MKEILNLFMNQRLRTKLMFSFVLAATVPLLIYTLVTAGYYLKTARETAVDYTRQMTSQVSGSLGIHIDAIEDMADYLASRRDIRTFLKQGDLQAPGSAEVLQDDMDRLLQAYPDIAGILITSPEDQWLASGISRFSRDSVAGASWFYSAVGEPETAHIISSSAERRIFLNDRFGGDSLFYLIRAVTDESGVLGVILIDMTHKVIEQAIENISIYEKGFVFVYDREDRIVYSPVNDIVYRVDPDWLHKESGPVTAAIGGETYQIESSVMDRTGWKVIGVFSVDEIQGDLKQAIYILTAVSILLMFFFFLIFAFLTKSLVEPILNLQNLMSSAAGGNLDVRFYGHYNDEVGDLGQSFNIMAEEINELIRMVYQEQQERQEAQLKSLQEQIKPHFLYNTLDTISWMARGYKAGDIVSLINALTTMFRVGLSQGLDIISLRDELSHASNYLYIQGIRYSEKIRYRIDVPDELLDLTVPKLILQPLIENAIYHGLKAKDEGGTIKIGGSKEENVLILTVEDDGLGISPDKLKQIRRTLNSEEKRDSFGLFYVSDRIRLHCGEHYGITVESDENIRTVLTLRLPLKKTGGGPLCIRQL